MTIEPSIEILSISDVLPRLQSTTPNKGGVLVLPDGVQVHYGRALRRIAQLNQPLECAECGCPATHLHYIKDSTSNEESKKQWRLMAWNRIKDMPTHLTIDHIIPISLGGGSGVHNLRILCKICNGERGAQIRPHDRPTAEGHTKPIYSILKAVDTIQPPGEPKRKWLRRNHGAVIKYLHLMGFNASRVKNKNVFTIACQMLLVDSKYEDDQSFLEAIIKEATITFCHSDLND